MNIRSGFIVFVLIGGFCSVVNLVARILINQSTSYEVAIVLAFLIALTTAFLLNRTFVFKSAGGAWRGQFLRFLLVNIITLLQVFGLSELFARVIFPSMSFAFHAETIAHGIGLLSPLLTSYWAHKHFSFRTKPAAVLSSKVLP